MYGQWFNFNGQIMCGQELAADKMKNHMSRTKKCDFRAIFSIFGRNPEKINEFVKKKSHSHNIDPNNSK